MARKKDRAADNRNGSLVDYAADRLREAIFDGGYPPGSNLRELRIAKELGISQSTVREALQRLESAGLVTRQANIGTTVTRLTPQEVRERVELRVKLEVQAAQAASRLMGAAEFEQLEQRLAALSAAIVVDSYYEAVQADLEFHRCVWRCSGNRTLAMVLDHVTVPLLAFVSMMRASGLEHLVDVTAAHEPLIQALRTGDDTEIEQAFTKGATSFYEEFMGLNSATRRARAFGMMDSGPSAPHGLAGSHSGS
ncbi:MAG: GntR family transcriptional regulator [Bryobacterales bacterium]|nr:GntR family transcriptional regulator [Bryobacterales bacterium]